MPTDLCIAPLYKLVDTSVYSRPTYTCVSCRPMYEFYMYTVYRRVVGHCMYSLYNHVYRSGLGFEC